MKNIVIVEHFVGLLGQLRIPAKKKRRKRKEKEKKKKRKKGKRNKK